MNTDRKLIMFFGSHKSKSYFASQNFKHSIELIKQKQTMYDINVFLENRREIVRAIEKLEFNFDGVGDYDYDSFEVELTRGNMQLVINATIRKTLTDSVADTYDEQGFDEFTTELEDVNEAFYYTSEGDEIPCTDNEIEAIKNVIKSLI